MQTESGAGPGPPAFTGCHKLSALGPQAKAGIVHLNQDSRVLLSSVRVLPKGNTRGSPREAGENVYRRVAGKT